MTPKDPFLEGTFWDKFLAADSLPVAFVHSRSLVQWYCAMLADFGLPRRAPCQQSELPKGVSKEAVGNSSMDLVFVQSLATFAHSWWTLSSRGLKRRQHFWAQSEQHPWKKQHFWMRSEQMPGKKQHIWVHSEQNPWKKQHFWVQSEQNPWGSSFVLLGSGLVCRWDIHILYRWHFGGSYLFMQLQMANFQELILQAVTVFWLLRINSV